MYEHGLHLYMVHICIVQRLVCYSASHHRGKTPKITQLKGASKGFSLWALACAAGPLAARCIVVGVFGEGLATTW